MSDDWSIIPFKTTWIFDPDTMSYSGYCSIRQSQYKILWDDLYKYALVSPDYWSFKANTIDAKLFHVNPYGAVELPISHDDIDTITHHAWQNIKTITGI